MSRQLRERKNISKVTDDEREALIRAFIALNTNPTFRFPGSKDDKQSISLEYPEKNIALEPLDVLGLELCL